MAAPSTQPAGPSFLHGCRAFLPCSRGKESLLPACPTASMCSRRGRHGQTGPVPATDRNLAGGPVPKIPMHHRAKPGARALPLPRAAPHLRHPPHIPPSRRATFSASLSWRGQARKPQIGEAGGGLPARLCCFGGERSSAAGSDAATAGSYLHSETQEGGLVMGPGHLGGHVRRADGLGKLVSRRSSSSWDLGFWGGAISSELLEGHLSLGSWTRREC